MDKEVMQRMLADAKEAAARAELEGYEGQADDGLEIARALLQVLGRKFGPGFVAEVQREILAHADDVARIEEPHCRDADEIRKVAGAGYFTDLLDEFASDKPSGRT